MSGTSGGPHEDYARRDQGPPEKLQNSHPDAAAAWLLLILRCFESGLIPAKDSSIKVIQMYLQHYIKSLSHVQLECRLSEDEERFLLTKFLPGCPRLAFINGGTMRASSPSPPKFAISELLKSCKELLKSVSTESESVKRAFSGFLPGRRNQQTLTFWCLCFYITRCFVTQHPLNDCLKVSPPSVKLSRWLFRPR